MRINKINFYKKDTFKMKSLMTILAVILAITLVRGNEGDCGDACQSSSDCCHPDKMFCCPHWHLCMDRETGSTAGPNCHKCNQEEGFFAGMHQETVVKSCPDHQPQVVEEEDDEEEVTQGGDCGDACQSSS